MVTTSRITLLEVMRLAFSTLGLPPDLSHVTDLHTTVLRRYVAWLIGYGECQCPIRNSRTYAP